MVVMGIDIGTQGVRVLVVDLVGNVLADASQSFSQEQITSSAPGAFEQDPLIWRVTLYETVAQAVSMLTAAGHRAEDILGLSVTSTSGTLCLANASGEPLGSALMYSDTRSTEVAHEVQAAGQELSARLGTRFGASYALTKLIWLRRHQPDLVESACWFTSPTDLALGWICGELGLTDWTNALKWGYDVDRLQWPGFIDSALALPLAKFPQVVAPGSLVGRVSAAMAQVTGLSSRTCVYAGATDGTASQLASGAASVGDWNSTLGTTLVLKGVTSELIVDPQGRLYCHRHPEGYWLPGGASSTGAECLSQRFDPRSFDRLNEEALRVEPTEMIIYPLLRTGERFPFVAPQAVGFELGQAQDEVTRFAAYLEGIAYVERLSYDLVQELGATVGYTIFSAGGGSRSSAGLQIRADILGRQLAVPRSPSGAMGAAILAASGVAGQPVSAMTANMVHQQTQVAPRQERRAAYDERYERFLAACRERGYLS